MPYIQLLLKTSVMNALKEKKEKKGILTITGKCKRAVAVPNCMLKV